MTTSTSLVILPRPAAETAVGRLAERELPRLIERVMATPGAQAAARLVARDPARWVLLVGPARYLRRASNEAIEGEGGAVAYRAGVVSLLHQERRLATAIHVTRWPNAGVGHGRIQLVAITGDWSLAVDAVVGGAR